MGDLLSELKAIFRDVLDDPRLEINRQSNPANVKGWDSLAHVTLLAAIEQQFGVRITVGESGGLKSVGDMVDLLELKLANRDTR